MNSRLARLIGASAATATATAVVTAGMAVATLPVASASQTSPPANFPPNPNIWASWNPSDSTVLKAINNAHTQAEGIPTITLPSNYSSLTQAQKLLVITNLERLSRGLPPVLGLNSVLDTAAEAGVQAGTDPTFPASAPFSYVAWGSNWAAVPGSVLEADYGWMYQDGEGGFNELCTATDTSGCFGHRDNILADWRSLYSPISLVMGAAGTRSGSTNDYTELFVAVPDLTPALYFTWHQELPYFDSQTIPVVAGENLSKQLIATNGVGPYTWTAGSSGSTLGGTVLGTTSVGDGLTLSPDGVLSGTPAQAGTFTFTATVTDANGEVVAQPTVTIAVAAPLLTTAVDSGASTSSALDGKSNISVSVPAGAFAAPEQLTVTTVPATSFIAADPAGTTPLASFSVSLSGSAATHPVSLTVANPVIPADARVYVQTPGGLTQVPAQVQAGKVTFGFRAGETVVIVAPVPSAHRIAANNLAWSSRTFELNGVKQFVVPGFTYRGTYYTSVYDVQQILNRLNLQNLWHMNMLAVTGSSFDATQMPTTYSGDAYMEVNGSAQMAVQRIVTAQPGSTPTSYVGIYDLERVLDSVGLNANGYNGTQQVWNIVG